MFHHFERFVAEYESRFERDYGYLKASMSRVLLLLDFDHRQRIQFFRAGEYAFRVQGAAISSDHNKKKSETQYLFPHFQECWVSRIREIGIAAPN
jgi:hypothetical protein